MMPSNATKAKIVCTKIEQGREGLFYATSPDLKGLFVAEDSLEKLEKAIPGVTRDLTGARAWAP